MSLWRIARTTPGSGVCGTNASYESFDLATQRLAVPEPEDVLIAVEFDEPCTGNPVGHVLAGCRRPYRVSAAIEDQGRNPNRRQQGTDVKQGV